MNKKSLLSILAVVAVAVGFYFILQKNKAKNEEQVAIVAEKNTEVVVRAVPVQYEDNQNEISVNGTFVAKTTANISAEMGGQLIALYVKEGSYVRPGQVIAKLKGDKLNVNTSNAQANLDQALSALARYEAAYKTGGVTALQLDQAYILLHRHSVALSENALKFMIGMPMEQDIDLPNATFEPSHLVSNEADFSQRTELKVLNKQLELLEWQKKASIAEYYPTAALTANYMWYGQGRKMPWFNGQSNGVYWSDISAIGLNINIPIFNGFAIKSKVEKNQIEIEKAQADLRETQLSLDLAYKNAVSQLENSAITISTQESNVKLAEEVVANTQANYKHGLATLNDILDADRDLIDARNNLTKAKLDYKLAEIELLKSQGKLRDLQ